MLAGGQSLIPVLKLRLAAPTLHRRPRQDRRPARHQRRRRRDRDRRDDDARRGGATARWSRSTRPCWRRRPRRWPTRRCATAAPSAVRWCTPIRPATCRRRSWRSTPSSSSPVPGGERTVAAADFFQDLFTTAVGEDEILTEIRIPKHTGWGGHYEKFTRVAQAWSIVARRGGRARPTAARSREAKIALTNMGSTAVARDRAVEQALVGAARDRGRGQGGRCGRLPTAPTRRPTPTATPTIVGTWRRYSPDGPCLAAAG